MWPTIPPDVPAGLYYTCVAIAVLVAGVSKSGFGGSTFIAAVPLMATVMPTRHMLGRMLRAYRHRLPISMELASVETIKKFVGAGLGISVISRSYALPEVEAGLLRLIPFEGIKLFRELGLIYRNDRHLSLPAKAFIEVIRQVRSVPEVSKKSKKTASA